MDWFYLIIAGLFEMAGVGMISRLHSKKNWLSLLLLIASFGGSFYFLSLAMKTLPMGTAYAVWTGIGASGGAILGMLFFGEEKGWKRTFFIALIICSVIGLKIVE